MSDTPITDSMYHIMPEGYADYWVPEYKTKELERKLNIVVAELNNIINSRPLTWDFGSKLETLEEYEIWTKSRARWTLEQIGER